MSDPVRFLQALAHALSAMALYPEEHPARTRAADAPHEELLRLFDADPRPSFTFLDDEVVFGREALRHVRGNEIGRRLADAGVQRLEFERRLSRSEFEMFLENLQTRLGPGRGDTSESRQTLDGGVRFGSVGLAEANGDDPAPVPASSSEFNLTDEAEAVNWLQQEVRSGRAVPMLEVETIVRALSVSMHSRRHVLLPLLHIKEFDQYTTTHSLNVSVLAMGLAESLGCSAREAVAYGMAGLLHDIGKIRIPVEILTKPGKLSPAERDVMNRHPEDGARIILTSEVDLDVAAVVAYEHHIMLNGGGYPRRQFERPCALASRLVHICDVYDALRTTRPYRDAWSTARTEAYLEQRSGDEFDGDIVAAFVAMLRQGEVELMVLDDTAWSADPG